MNVSKLVCAVVVLAAFVSEGATIYSKGSGSEPSVMSSSIWSNNKAPEAGNDYICQRTVHTDGVTESAAGGVTLLTFPGDSLTMQKAGDNVADFLIDSTYQGSSWVNFPRGGFIMEGDVNLRYWSANKANYTINITGGCFTVKAPYRDGIPSIRGMSQDSDCTSTYVFHLPFKGGEDAILLANHHKSGYPGAGRLEFKSDASEFLGTISLDYNNSAGLFGNAFGGTIDLAGSSSFLTFAPGSDTELICTVACVTSEVSNAKLVLVGKASAEIGSLTFPGGRIEIPSVVENGKYAGGSIAVTDHLDLASQAQITVVVPGEVIPLPEEGDSRANEFVILSAPQSAGRLSLADFILSVTACTGTTQDDVALAVRVDEETGLQQLIVRRRNVSVVTQKVTDSSATHGSSLDAKNAGNWTDGQVPHPGADYCIPSGNQLMTTAGVANHFKGETLDLPGTLVLNARLDNEGYITLYGGQLVRTFSSNSCLAGGVVEIHKAGDGELRKVNIECNSDGSYGLDIASELVGDGFLVFKHNGDTNLHSTPYRLSGNNHWFAGRIWLDGKSWSASTKKRITLEFTDPSNFGNHRATLDMWALRFYDAFVLKPTRSMTFTDLNCGFMSQDNSESIGNFKVDAGIRLNLCNSYTLYSAGLVRKTGAGTLGLGGSLGFIGNNVRVTTPQGTETFEIQEGWVQPLTEGGGNGALYRFGAGAGIRLRSGLDVDDPLRVYGLKNVKTCAARTGLLPFDTMVVDGKIAVAIDGLTPKTREKLAVLTVKGHDAAAAICDKLVFANDGVEGVGAEFSVRDNGDDTSTVEVQCVSTLGLMLIFR